MSADSPRSSGAAVPPRFGIIGHPLTGTLSPKLFAAAYGGKYSYELFEGTDFEEVWARLSADTGVRAINVTAPFKELAFDKVRASGGAVCGPACKIGATNLIVREDDGSLSAHNSDFSGIILSVAESYFPGLVAQCYQVYGNRGHIKVHQFVRENLPALFPDKPQALIVGCGGAGRAAAVAAAEMGFETALMNRTPERAQHLAEDLPEYHFLPVPFSDLQASLRECDLVIYTLPEAIPALELLTADDFAGNDPESDNAAPRPDKRILEAVYKTPAFTGTLLARLENGGARYIPGTQWLLYQAVSGYGLMTGEPCDISAMTTLVGRSRFDPRN